MNTVKGVKAIQGFQNRHQNLAKELSHRDNSQLRKAVKSTMGSAFAKQSSVTPLSFAQPREITPLHPN